MTFQQLEYYQSCAIFKSFSRAAQYHYISESTLSRQISSLENELGASLFDRGARGVELTYAGILFFQTTVEMFQQFSEYRLALAGDGIIRQETTPFFRIACYVADNVFPRLVEMLDFLPADWHGGQCKIDIFREGAAAKAVLENTAHVGIELKINLREYGSVFDMQPFAKAPIPLLVGKTHELSGRGSIELSELISKFHDRGCYFFPEILEDIGCAFRDCKINTLSDILLIRKIFARFLPFAETLSWLKCPDHRILIPPTVDMLSAKLVENLCHIELTGVDEDAVEHVVFWKKEMCQNPNVAAFIESLAQHQKYKK